MLRPDADLVLDILNAAAGTLIDLDPDGKQKLTQLRGKVFCLEVTAPAIKLYLLPNERGIEFCRTIDGTTPPDVTLRGPACAFARLGRGGDLKLNRLSIDGDAELAQALQKILGQLDFDWEELLSRYFGDTPAHKFANAARGLANWAEKSLDLTRENVGDYLREEKRMLVTNPAMARFDKNLNRTRADVDRLTKRIARLDDMMNTMQQKTKPASRN